MQLPLFHLRLKHALVFSCALTLAACASAPADHGLGEVRSLAQARGLKAAELTTSATPDASGNDETQRLLDSPLSAAAAVQLAFLNEPRIAAEYARLGLSSADVVSAGRLSNPVLSGSWQHNSRSEGASRYDFGLSQNFIELLMLPARRRLAAGEFERTQLEVTQALLDLATEVQRDYISAVGAAQIAALRNTIAEAADAAADLSQRQLQAGNTPALDDAAMQAAASDARLDAEQAQADASLSNAALNRTMGLPADAHWQLAGSLPAPVSAEDAPETLRKLALTARADLESDRRAEAVLGDALGTTRAFRFLGDFDLGVDYERDTDRARLLGPSFSLQLPLFNQGQDAVLRAQSRVELARATRRAHELEIGNAVDAAYARTQAARARIKRLREQTIPLREQVVAGTQARVNYMLTGVFELLRARQDEYAAYQRYLEAVRDYWLARTDLSRAVGTRLPSDDGLAIESSLLADLPALDTPATHAAAPARPAADTPP